MHDRGLRSPHFDIVAIEPGTWAAIARDGGYALCNAGIFDLGGRTVVFDTMLTPLAGGELRRAAERLTGRRPDLVVNSHWHGDHIRGNEAFRPAPIVATRTTRALVETQGPAQWRSDLRSMPRELRRLDAEDSDVPPRERALYRGWFEGTLRVPRPFHLTPPDHAFEGRMTVVGDRRELEIVTYGGGHSPSDTFVHLPESHVVALGDLLTVGLHPSAGDGEPRRWAPMLRRVRALGVRIALPGHGALAGPTELGVVEGYLRGLVRRAVAARRAGTSLRRLLESPMPSAYREWKFSAFYPDNLARAYDQARPTSGARRP